MWKTFAASLNHTEARLVLVLLSAIVAADLALRAVDQDLSGNLAHIAEIPALIDTAAASGQPAVLVLGNSLTNNGIATDVLAQRLPDRTIAKVTPDGTNYWDWQCLLQHQVAQREDVQFDTVVMGYAWHLLSDQTPPDPSRLGALYCSFDDLMQPSRIGLDSIGDIGEFTLARALRLYALRDTLRNRTLSLVVPGYQQFTQSANVNRAAAAVSADIQQYSYRRFSALAAQLKARGTQLVVVAMPVRSEYSLDPELIALADQGQIRLLDYRRIPGIAAASYLDNMHLNGAGQRVLSTELAAALAPEAADAQ